MPPKNAYSWEQDSAKVCELIHNSPSLLRIILKTKDEETLIEKWIQHYLNIAQKAEDILIFDNMSTNERVLDVYKKYEDKIILITYSSHFNFIHDPRAFSPLYQSIWESSKFYTFIDTDEFLHLYDGEKIIADSRILKLLEYSHDVNFYPTFWLKNAYFKENIFSYKASKEYMRYLIAMGKPILNSEKVRNKIKAPMAHSLQMPISVYGNAPSYFLLLHLSTLSKEQRIRVNMDKLVQYGFIKTARDFFTVLKAEIDSIENENVKYFIKEIRHLLSIPAGHGDIIEPGHIEIMRDGTLKFYPDEAKEVFNKYTGKDVSFFKLLDFAPTASTNPNTIIWEIFDNESYLLKTPPQNKWEF